MGELLSYCRLMAAWLLHLACPSSAPGADIQLPLPASAPMEFRTLPVRSWCWWQMVTAAAWRTQASIDANISSGQSFSARVETQMHDGHALCSCAA